MGSGPGSARSQKKGGPEEPAKKGFWQWIPINVSDWKKVLCEFMSQAAFNYCSCSAVAAATVLGAGKGLLTTMLVMAAHMVLVPLLIFTFGPISGAHFNPMVTATFIATRTIALSTGVAYVVAQICGGVIGAAAAFYSLPTSQQVAGYAGLNEVPLDHTVLQAFLGELYASFLFIMFLSGVVLDKRGWGKLGPLALGMIVPLLMWIEGPVSSMCINPARAFGPAFVTGSWDNHWIFWTAPFLGGVPAALIYKHLFSEGAIADAGPQLHLGEWLAGGEASLMGREQHLVLHFMKPEPISVGLWTWLTRECKGNVAVVGIWCGSKATFDEARESMGKHSVVLDSGGDIARQYSASPGEVLVLDAAGSVAWRGWAGNVQANLEAVLSRSNSRTHLHQMAAMGAGA